MEYTKVQEYIENHWDETIKENRQDKGTLIGMPYPYCVPAVGYFDEMYYWDTFFTNKGLALAGRMAQVKNNTDNMLYLVDKYGYMPNGNRTYYLKNSQPPFLSMMVRDVYGYYKDGAWLRGAYDVLGMEYEFWMAKRRTACGLNGYGGALTPDMYEEMAAGYSERFGGMPEGSLRDIAMHYVICCESGWDINPRWQTEGCHYAPVDLNSLLYGFEKNMEYFAQKLQNGQEGLWSRRAGNRKSRMFELMDDGSGILLDYNFDKGQLSPVLSAASFYPLFVKLADQKQAEALVRQLPRLEAEYGLLTCEKGSAAGNYQWDYPNGWSCIQYIAVIGLDNYGYREEARRLALKHTLLVEKVFEETGNLWEKYNVVEGNINVSNEYEMPAMMGWTAGVYLELKEYGKLFWDGSLS